MQLHLHTCLRIKNNYLPLIYGRALLALNSADLRLGKDRSFASQIKSVFAEAYLLYLAIEISSKINALTYY